MDNKSAKIPFWAQAAFRVMRMFRLPELPESPKEGKWYRVTMKGFEASDGSQYFFNFRKGTENNLMIFLHGGGVSWDEYMAARPTELNAEDLSDCYYFPRARDYGVFGSHGVLSMCGQNPFRRWSVISLPYCTGDFHCGNGDFPYMAQDGTPHILRHHGYRNAIGAVKNIRSLFAISPDRLLVTGNSAGGFGTALLTAEFVKLFPECKDVTAFVDSGFALLPDARRIAGKVWHAPDTVVGKIHSDNITLDSLTGLKKEYGDRIKILFSCSCRDVNLAQIKYYISGKHRLFAGRKEGIEFQQELKNMCTDLLNRIPDAAVYIFDTPASGEDKNRSGLTRHCIAIDDTAYTVMTEGQTVMQWLWDGVNGRGRCIGLNLLKPEKTRES